MTQLFSNNATATLLSGITNSETSLVISPGSEVLFPTIASPSDFFIITLESDNLFEIVKVTATSANTFTCIRGQEGTTARAWPAGTVVELRLTAGGIQKIQADIGSGGVVNLGLGSTVDSNSIWHAGNDGTGSTLDADLLDGQHASAFAQANNAALIGVPTAPTAAVDTNTTQIATTQFVLNQASDISPLMNGVAAAGSSERYSRGDHVHATDTSRAPLLSPAFTGTPTAPTAAVNTNTTQLATTAFVVGQKGVASPLMNGVAAAGSSLRYSSEDHIHPSDTTKLDSSEYTASDVLTKIKTVDGTGSGLDADLLDGLNSTDFIRSGFLSDWNSTPSEIQRVVTSTNSFNGVSTTIGAIFPHTTPASFNFAIAARADNLHFKTLEAGVQGPWRKIWHEANDGSGSGLDADTLDGLQATAFPTLAGNNTFTGSQTISSTLPILVFNETDQVLPAGRWRLDVASDTFRILKNTAVAGDFATANIPISIGPAGTTVTFNSTPQVSGNNVWHAGNDGAGSGLDADTLDGIQGSAFAQLSGASFTGAINSTNNIVLSRSDTTTLDIINYSTAGGFRLRNNGASGIFELDQLSGTGSVEAAWIVGRRGAATELYHNGSKKFETSAAGVTITGTATATGFSGSGASLTSLNAGNISSGTLAVARGGTGTTTNTGTGSVVLSTSPTFSGSPLVPDYAATSRRVAWTPIYLTLGATGNFTTAHLGNIVDLAAGITVTIPAGLGGTSGEMIQVISMSNTTTITPGVGVTLTWLQGTTSSTGSRTLGTKAVVTLVKRSVGTDDWIIYGNGIS